MLVPVWCWWRSSCRGPCACRALGGVHMRTRLRVRARAFVCVCARVLVACVRRDGAPLSCACACACLFRGRCSLPPAATEPWIKSLVWAQPCACAHCGSKARDLRPARAHFTQHKLVPAVKEETGTCFSQGALYATTAPRAHCQCDGVQWIKYTAVRTATHTGAQGTAQPHHYALWHN